MNTPMEVLTYSLRAEGGTSAFFRRLSEFSDTVLGHLQGECGPSIERLCNWVQATAQEELRSRDEYGFDLLTTGVLMMIWGGRAEALPRSVRALLAALTRWRRVGERAQAAADLGRGLIGGLIRQEAPGTEWSLESLARLRDWLVSTGVYEQEAQRLGLWIRGWSEMPAAERRADLAACRRLAVWFRAAAAQALGCYTPNVERFLSETWPRYRWRADALFCGRPPVEYHRNMVGTEILNRAHRPAFLRTRRRLVLVPPCMRAQSDPHCRARAASWGAQCAGCTPDCRVFELTRLGRRRGFEVRILPDDLRVYRGGPQPAASSGRVGIVGVSCALTNASGGLETRALGIPAQGALLDYCGCSYHWHRQGFPTDVDSDQLLRLVGERPEADRADQAET